MFIRDESEEVVAILGFRVEEYLWSGLTLTVDNFATLRRARGKGFGHLLMEWTINNAKVLNCEEISLDSTYSRTDAHRFYMNHKFVTDSHHFVQKL